ncbi:MAG: agmatine deiminase family protein [Muribaculaceae bacterium]|nr:agmatine deiminase family protein [Muribaculaceae bacterium]
MLEYEIINVCKMSNCCNDAIMLLPEWIPSESILMALPNKNTDWNYILDEARGQYRRIIKSLTDENVTVVLLCDDAEDAANLLDNCNQDKIRYVEIDYNDTWVRDYGPITVIKNNVLTALDFGFNGWGLKFASDKDNLVNLHMMRRGIIPSGAYENAREFVLEGGSIETDGNGTLLTTSRCLCSENRNGGLSKENAEDRLRHYLGVSNVLFLDYGALDGDDTDSHIDTLARMAPGNTIIMTVCDDRDDLHHIELEKMRTQIETFRNTEGEPFNLVEVPLPDAIFDEEGNRLPATYANYLVTEKVVFVPTYGREEKDYRAIDAVKKVFPSHKVVGIDCNTLIKQHGSLHCATMKIPAKLLNKNLNDI